MLNSTSPTLNTDGGIGLDVRVKAKRPKTMTVAWGLPSSDCGKEISWRRRSPFSVIEMARKVVIGRVEEGHCYGFYAMDGSGSSREENSERRTCHCVSLRSGSGVEYVAPHSKVLYVILAASPVVKNGAECRWRREEYGSMMGLEFEAFWSKL